MKPSVKILLFILLILLLLLLVMRKSYAIQKRTIPGRGYSQFININNSFQS